ncbi:gamma-glutamyl-gamma-aminobutyrate hydrolase family protein [Nocardioides endophyticus]|uniref:Gamma-glutamyl-gamma-aminobutyrate hydrolase family protein n=1 Tax=Nocardioides endophyticus TaxID=1353775 RepID=A0ABP8Z0I6_9ACTN
MTQNSNCAGTGPIIGVAANEGPISFGPWSRPAVFVPSAYLERLRDLGAVPVLLPPGVPAEEVVTLLDALLLIGGADVDPSHYGADPHEMTVPADEPRDVTDLALTRAAIARDLPMLAICRGLQVLNVALGGSLTQHLPETVGHHDHLARADEFVRHEVSLVNPVTGAREISSVPSYHHQALDQVAPDLEPWAWAPDGTIEAACHKTATWIHGVQWHPEMGDELKVFDQFVAVAIERHDKGVEGKR